MELNFKTMASAYLNVLEGYDFIIPEDVPANERTAFHGAAAAAHKSGKSHFDFGGKKYPVTMKKDAAKAINSDTQKEAKEDEPEASTEVDGNDEKEAGMKKVPCPKCEGKGCAHCDEKGYHISKVESSCGSDGKKSRKESVEEETELNELSAEEKKLVNQMYDKKGNLTPLGKKVMNHGKKPGDKGYVENTNEEAEEGFLDEDITHQTVKPPNHTKKFSGKDSRDTNSIGGGGNKSHTVTSSQADAHDKTAAHHNEVADAHKKAGEKSSSSTLQRLHHQASVHHKKAAEAHFNASHSSSGADKDGSIQKRAKDLHTAYHLTMHANNMSQEARNKGTKAKRMNNESVELDEISRSMTPMKNKFGGTVIPKKFDTYKKFVKKNNVDEPTVRMICDNPDAAESKRMMKNPKIAQAVDLYKAAHMKKESVSEKKKYLSQKDIKRAIASIKPPKKKPTLPKAPWDKKESTLPAAAGGKKSVRSADKKPVNVNVDGKTVTRMEPVTKRSAAAYESVNRKNWVDVLQNKKLQEAEDAKTKTSAPTGNHKSDDATRDTYDKQLATRKGEKDFVDMHNPETPEYADVNRVLPKTFAAFTAGVKAGGGKTNDAPGDKAMPKNDGK
mgnify:CR=1 FL=1